MAHRSKYIVLDKGLYPIPVVFSDDLIHSEVAGALGGKVLGAGFCFTEDDRYQCYGESTSLRVASRPQEDAEILNRYLGAVYSG